MVRSELASPLGPNSNTAPNRTSIKVKTTKIDHDVVDGGGAAVDDLKRRETTLGLKRSSRL